MLVNTMLAWFEKGKHRGSSISFLWLHGDTTCSSAPQKLTFCLLATSARRCQTTAAKRNTHQASSIFLQICPKKVFFPHLKKKSFHYHYTKLYVFLHKTKLQFNLESKRHNLVCNPHLILFCLCFWSSGGHYGCSVLTVVTEMAHV